MAILGVDDFKSKLVGGGARPNLFKATVNFPAFAGGEVELTSFLIKGAQLPASTIGTINVPFRGRQVLIAGDRTFEPWTITVINDEDFTIRNSMENWLNLINSHTGNLRDKSAITTAGYSIDAIVTQYGKTGNELKKYNFVGMFPIDVSPIDLDWGSNDTIEEFAVTFAYQYWEANTTS
mgnify:CR=1 FL=1